MPKITVSRGERTIEAEISDEAARIAAVDILMADTILKAVGEQRGASPEVITEKRKLAAALADTSNNKDKKG